MLSYLKVPCISIILSAVSLPTNAIDITQECTKQSNINTSIEFIVEENNNLMALKRKSILDTLQDTRVRMILWDNMVYLV